MLLLKMIPPKQRRIFVVEKTLEHFRATTNGRVCRESWPDCSW